MRISSSFGSMSNHRHSKIIAKSSKKAMSNHRHSKIIAKSSKKACYTKNINAYRLIMSKQNQQIGAQLF
ncbi:hypothetical protein KFK09_012062 [Dendrobium nobile]|uniref:Uncharacterized protein n=1 Tax=Dendrobium nobile TaxID=94219 RepID=A0A8T3BEC4_DENNO|nr:hypothetical protein KFK09_012062 [Dendrobium nobile]